MAQTQLAQVPQVNGPFAFVVPAPLQTENIPTGPTSYDAIGLLALNKATGNFYINAGLSYGWLKLSSSNNDYVSSLIVNTTGSAPAAGTLGENIASSVAASSAVSSLTTAVTNVTSIALTAGVWDVRGMVMYTGMTTATFQQASISTTSATLGTVGINTINGVWTSTTPGDFGLAIPTFRLLATTTTTVYLVGSGTYSAGTGKLYGSINATRVA